MRRRVHLEVGVVLRLAVPATAAEEAASSGPGPGRPATAAFEPGSRSRPRRTSADGSIVLFERLDARIGRSTAPRTPQELEEKEH